MGDHQVNLAEGKGLMALADELLRGCAFGFFTRFVFKNIKINKTYVNSFITSLFAFFGGAGFMTGACKSIMACTRQDRIMCFVYDSK